ncbi:MAG: metal-sulfur cluster assembly factor [Candidatus Dormibacteria bacterium]
MTASAGLPLLSDHGIEQESWERLREVYDPELGIDLVNLGLVYALRSDGGAMTVAMTLTTPGCPMGGSIPDQVRFSLETIPGVKEVKVDLVFEPAWEPEMMSAEAKRRLGWH